MSRILSPSLVSVLLVTLFPASFAMAGVEYTTLSAFEAAMDATVAPSDWTSLSDGQSVDGMPFVGYQLDLLAGAGLAYDITRGVVLTANNVNNTTLGITLDAEAYGIGLEVTSIYADLVAEGYDGGILVDSVNLSNPGSETIPVFYGLVFTSSVDEVHIVSTSNGDGIVFEDVLIDYDDDGDGITESAGDCDDANPLVSPAATETCNGVDDDCNGSIDEGFDADADGYTTCAGDCDDGDASVNPGVPEVVCDGVDNDCDGSTDEDDPGSACYDDDGDGYTEDDGDCDDSDAAIYLGAPELCNGLDEDCDTQIDEGFVDSDGDGLPDCLDEDDDGDGYTPLAGDCNDLDSAVNPGAFDIPDDGIDQDCDGSDAVTPGDDDDVSPDDDDTTPPVDDDDSAPVDDDDVTPPDDDDDSGGDDDSGDDDSGDDDSAMPGDDDSGDDDTSPDDDDTTPSDDDDTTPPDDDDVTPDDDDSTPADDDDTSPDDDAIIVENPDMLSGTGCRCQSGRGGNASWLLLALLVRRRRR